MGEVYRADDLKLSQPVALKFLPDSYLSDGAALARFHREVRVARQVSHRNVCRVYDIGEIDGRHFYVDGVHQGRGAQLSPASHRPPAVRQSHTTRKADLRRSGSSDIYSLGLVLYELFTDKRAFEASTLLTAFYPMTTDFSAWYASSTVFALTIVLGLAIYGFYTSLGGQRVFGGKLLNDNV